MLTMILYVAQGRTRVNVVVPLRNAVVLGCEATSFSQPAAQQSVFGIARWQEALRIWDVSLMRRRNLSRNAHKMISLDEHFC